MNSIKFNPQLLQKSSFYSYSPINVLKRSRLSCLTHFTSKNTSLRFVTSTATSRISTLTHNNTLINKSFPLSSYPNIFNNKRYFSNFLSLNFWSTRRALKPLSSIPLNFFDLSTSTNKSTSNVPLTNLSSASTQTQNLSPSDSPTPSTPTPPPLPIIINPAATKRNKLILNHGGSGIPKQSENLISTKIDGNYQSIGCGEDSFFLRYDALGVADGVGGWRNVALHNSSVSADSSLYSRKLMHYSYAELERYDNIDDEKYYHHNKVNPVDIMQASFEQTMKDCALEGIIGSSTLLTAILREDELRIANLGDCSIGVIRYNEYIFRNEEQQHSFNYPYQLGTGSLNTPQDSQKFTVKTQPGDIIVMGSDGLFDNLFEEDILEEIISCQKQNGWNPQIISDTLAWKAKIMSVDINNCSPFQSRAIQEGLYYQGGKRDDISVLVAVVSDNR